MAKIRSTVFNCIFFSVYRSHYSRISKQTIMVHMLVRAQTLKSKSISETLNKHTNALSIMGVITDQTSRGKDENGAIEFLCGRRALARRLEPVVWWSVSGHTNMPGSPLQNSAFSKDSVQSVGKGQLRSQIHFAVKK